MSDRIGQRDRPDAGSVPASRDGPPPADGKPVAAAGLASASAFAERYEIRRCLERSEAGEAFEAFDRTRQRLVRLHRLACCEERCSPPCESRLADLHRLIEFRHPSVVPLSDAGLDGDGLYLVVEPVDGDLLSDLLPASGPLDVETIAGLASQICDALSAAHQVRLRHGGLCLERVLITDSGDAMLLGFGWSDVLPHGETPARDLTSPEQRHNHSAGDHRSDIWGLGAVIHAAATGEPPHRRRAEHLPEPLRGPVLKALEDDPDQRFQTVAEFRAALQGTAVVEADVAALSPALTADGELTGTAGRDRLADAEEGFAAWYRRRFHWAIERNTAQSALLQGLLWTGLGFVWIPCWYLASASRSSARVSTDS